MQEDWCTYEHSDFNSMLRTKSDGSHHMKCKQTHVHIHNTEAFLIEKYLKMTNHFFPSQSQKLYKPLQIRNHVQQYVVSIKHTQWHFQRIFCFVLFCFYICFIIIFSGYFSLSFFLSPTPKIFYLNIITFHFVFFRDF